MDGASHLVALATALSHAHNIVMSEDAYCYVVDFSGQPIVCSSLNDAINIKLAAEMTEIGVGGHSLAEVERAAEAAERYRLISDAKHLRYMARRIYAREVSTRAVQQQQATSDDRAPRRF